MLGIPKEKVLVTKVLNAKPGERKYEYYVPEQAHAAVRRQLGNTLSFTAEQ